MSELSSNVHLAFPVGNTVPELKERLAVLTWENEQLIRLQGLHLQAIRNVTAALGCNQDAPFPGTVLEVGAAVQLRIDTLTAKVADLERTLEKRNSLLDKYNADNERIVAENQRLAARVNP